MTRTEHADGKGGVASIGLTMQPVYSDDPKSENWLFWNATPSGQLQMTINNPEAFGHFKSGRAYYLDFTEAPAQ